MLCCLALVSYACGDSGSPSLSPIIFGFDVAFYPGVPEELVLPGQSYQLRIFPYDSAGEDIAGVTADEWNSSDPSVATVDDAGLVTAHAPGLTTISVRVDTLSKEFPLVVSPS